VEQSQNKKHKELLSRMLSKLLLLESLSSNFSKETTKQNLKPNLTRNEELEKCQQRIKKQNLKDFIKSIHHNQYKEEVEIRTRTKNQSEMINNNNL
jgi:hypothetical protein